MNRRPRISARWTLRSALVAVAVVACGLGLFAWSRRRTERFRDLVRYHRAAASWVGIDFMPGPFCGNAYAEEPWYQAERGAIRRRFIREAEAFHKALALKYRGALACPWLPVAPEPTPPPLAYPGRVVDPRTDRLLARP